MLTEHAGRCEKWEPYGEGEIGKWNKAEIKLNWIELNKLI